MTSGRGNTILFRSSQQIPRLRLGPLTHPHALLPELQRYKDTFGCAALGADVPERRQLQLTQTLIVHLLDSQFFLLYQKLDALPLPSMPLCSPPVLPSAFDVELGVNYNQHLITSPMCDEARPQSYRN